MKEGNGVVHSQLFHVITLTFESNQIIFHPVFLFLFVLACVCVSATNNLIFEGTVMTSAHEASEAPILYALIVT